jgi:hypothetical protein
VLFAFYFHPKEAAWWSTWHMMLNMEPLRRYPWGLLKKKIKKRIKKFNCCLSTTTEHDGI